VTHAPGALPRLKRNSDPLTGDADEVSIVVANTSSSIDSLSGDAAFDNDDAAFVGLASANASTVVR